ncbi:MAG: GNAT family N-acetyltransferase, partial [Chloroflexi bacterium]|nr:GNAT family N-acetyltransferase [Chloroflexota bacterium]
MINIRTVERGDHPWVASLLREQWGSTRFVTRGRLWDAEELPGLIAVRDGNRVGLATYHLQGDECELTTFNSLVERVGVGSALLQSVRDIAVSAGCKRLWLITTNDNTAALRFYQKQGFVLVAVYPNAMEQYRRLKPEIPLVGNDGIPI